MRISNSVRFVSPFEKTLVRQATEEEQGSNEFGVYVSMEGVFSYCGQLRFGEHAEASFKFRARTKGTTH
jgi:hypothetical protein